MSNESLCGGGAVFIGVTIRTRGLGVRTRGLGARTRGLGARTRSED